MAMISNQYDEIPTRYDLYYCKWNLYRKIGDYDSVLDAIYRKVITEQDAENYYYFLLIAYIKGISWYANCDYCILTDYDTPRVLTRLACRKHILDFREKKFILSDSGDDNDINNADDYIEDLNDDFTWGSVQSSTNRSYEIHESLNSNY
jgi:hypothetical protein